LCIEDQDEQGSDWLNAHKKAALNFQSGVISQKTGVNS